MPQVPVQDTQTVFGEAAGGNYETVQANPDAFGLKVGTALSAAGDDLQKIATTQQQQFNENTVNDTDANVYSPKVRDIRNQFLTLQGKDAVDAMPATLQAIQDARTDTRSALTNPKQQEMFDTIARKRTEIELDGVARYGDQQQKVYEAATFKAGLENQTAQAADNYNDEQRFGNSLGTAQYLIDQYGSSHGWSTEQMKAEEAKFVSTTQTQRVQRWAQDDPQKAQDYYQQHTSDFEPALRPNIEKLLKNSLDPILQRKSAEDITSGYTAGNSQGAGAVADLHAAVQSAESGNNPDAVSPAGAKGLMQVLDSTNKDPGFGVRPAADDSKAERVRVGNDYLDAMLTRYGGNQTAALAAYNWGPGNVDKLISNGVSPGSPQFTSALPAETQAYVAKINAKVPPSDVTPPSTIDVKLQLPTWIQQAKDTAEATRPGDQVYADGLVARVVQHANIIEQGTRAVQDNARDQLVNGIVGMKQADGGTLDDLLAQPGMTTNWNAATPETRMAIQNKFKANGVNGPPRSMDTVQLQSTLMGRALNPDPGVRDAFMNEDLTKYYGQLPDKDFNEVVAQQNSMKRGLDKDSARQVDFSKSLSIADASIFKNAKLGPVATGGTQSARDARDLLVSRFDDALNAFKTNTGKVPQQADILQIARGLTATVSTPGKLFGTNDTPAFKLTPDQEATATVKLPPVERTSLTNGFQSRYGRAPSESEVQQLAIAQRLHSTDPAYLSNLDSAFRAVKPPSSASIALRGAQ